MSVVLIVIALLAVAFAAAALISWRRLRGRLDAAEARASELDEHAANAERRAEGIFERLPASAARVDAGGRILAVTGALRARFPDVEPGESMISAFGSHELVAAVDRALSGGSPQSTELRLFGTERRTYRALVEPLGGPHAVEATLVLSDFTEALAFQELRSQFVANVSHELRTPLTGLRGLLEALEDEDVELSVRARMVARAAAETRRLEAIIGDVLFLSELEVTEALPTDGPSDLADAALRAVDESTVLGRESGVSLALDLPDEAWTPLTEAMASTVVRNLVENAIRYAGPGATARVSIDGDARNVTLTVADDGAGISDKHLPHVFERFYRADPSRSRQLGGTGLGLSIVKHIAERFGGHAAVRSREGFGAEFSVTLPRAAPARAAGPVPPLETAENETL